MHDCEQDILIAYALRFDGYSPAFEADEHQQLLSHAVATAIEDAVYPTDLITQLRCFFNMQRFLCKWGGESLPECSAQWRVYRTLFLMTALADVPIGYRHPERYASWAEEYEPHRHQHLAIVAAAHHQTRYLYPSDREDTAGFERLNHYFEEDYLIGHTGHYFRAYGTLTAESLFSIIIWKANRAKTKLAAMLLNRFPSKSLDEIAKDIAKSLSAAVDDRERLRLLIEEFGFRLPMTSAILTILYPDQFTVFDVRVCEMLGFDGQSLKRAESTKFSKVWAAYCDYLERVRATYPRLNSLRDKDRALWAKSAGDQLKRDIARSFRTTTT